jgi:hypothetical protein
MRLKSLLGLPDDADDTDDSALLEDDDKAFAAELRKLVEKAGNQ